MIPYVILLLAILSRILPPALHLTAMNFTALGGSLLFFGSRTTRRTGLHTAVALLALMSTDILLTTRVYGFPFHITGYLITWAWYAAVILMAHAMLAKPTFLRTTFAVLASSTSFFLLSNFVVWLGHMYPHTAPGLAACYTAALPFYRNDLVSTTLVATVLFGLPALATRLVESLQPRQDVA